MRALVFTVVVWACLHGDVVAAFFPAKRALPGQARRIGDPARRRRCRRGPDLPSSACSACSSVSLSAHARRPAAGLGLLVIRDRVSQIPGKISKNVGEYMPDAAGRPTSCCTAARTPRALAGAGVLAATSRGAFAAFALI